MTRIFMAAPDYLIKNCTSEDFELACPKLWSGLKPSLTAAVRHCHHCNRKVYLCTTDADLKLYTSLNYCIAIIEPLPPAEKEWEARTQGIAQPTGGVGRQIKGEVFTGVPLRRDGRQAPRSEVLPKDLSAYEVPTHQRMPLPDADKK
jgi:hypothetical protein